MAIQNSASKIKVGISSCLLGEKVLWDGNHKLDPIVNDLLGSLFEWVPTCPEVEVGMGIPREAMQLTGNPETPRMVGNTTGTDWTQRMNRYSKKRSVDLEKMGVCGYIFKSKSPSCGIARIKVYGDDNTTVPNGRGLFAKAFMQQSVLMPVEDEERLHDTRARENFITRVFAYRRLNQLLNGRLSRKILVEFHNAHKFLLLAHSRKHEIALGKLIANAKQYFPSELKRHYAEAFMQALSYKTTPKKNADVLYHMLGFFKKLLSEAEKQNLVQAIEDYRNGLTSLIKPITLIKHHARKYKVDYLTDQVYLRPLTKRM